MRSVPEWIGKTDDSAIPPRVQDRVSKRAIRQCAHCGNLVGGIVLAAFDHVIALCNGGENRESNLQLLCVPCHKVKTKADVALKKINNRVKAKHLGIRKPRSIRAWRKFDGTIVRAERER